MNSAVSHFDHRAKHVLAMAQAAAMQLNHRAIGTEHLLLGILRTECPARDVLSTMAFDLQTAQAAVESVAPPGGGDRVIPREISLSDAARGCIERADSLRQERKHVDLTPSHLLLALVSEEDSTGARVLAARGLMLPEIAQRAATTL